MFIKDRVHLIWFMCIVRQFQSVKLQYLTYGCTPDKNNIPVKHGIHLCQRSDLKWCMKTCFDKNPYSCEVCSSLVIVRLNFIWRLTQEKKYAHVKVFQYLHEISLTERQPYSCAVHCSAFSLKLKETYKTHTTKIPCFYKKCWSTSSGSRNLQCLKWIFKYTGEYFMMWHQ